MTDTALTPRDRLASVTPSVNFGRGVFYGFAAVLIWGGYLAMTRAGAVSGFTAADFALMRCGIAGLVLLPWLLRHEPATLAGVGWGRTAILTVLVGPAYVMLAVAAYAFSPLAHGAVIQPSSAVLGTTLAGFLFFRERPKPERLIGLALIVAGIAAISGPGLSAGSALTPLGDAMFITAGFCWAAFTILIGRWRLGGMQVAAATSVLSAAIVLPGYAILVGFGRLATFSTGQLLSQALMQGILSGVLATVFFARAVHHLGAGRAALFPALVPGTAILIGIPVTGELPTGLQVAGLLLVSAGLLVALGLVGALAFRRSP